MGWNEITGDNIRGEAHLEASQSEKLAKGTLVHFWDGDIGLINKAINEGYSVVNSNRHYTYLDYPYEVTPLEKAYSFHPVPDGIAGEKVGAIVGLGCQMWGEYTPNQTRIYYQTFPRIAAYAECGWTKAEDKNYDEFRHRMKRPNADGGKWVTSTSNRPTPGRTTPLPCGSCHHRSTPSAIRTSYVPMMAR